MGLSVSNNVSVRADTLNAGGILAGYGSTFILVGKHTFGDRAYAREAESTAAFQCQNGGVTWVNVTGLGMVTTPVASAIADLSGGVGCGGAEIVNWTEM
jgi:hypothetical protein